MSINKYHILWLFSVGSSITMSSVLLFTVAYLFSGEVTIYEHNPVIIIIELLYLAIGLVSTILFAIKSIKWCEKEVLTKKREDSDF